MCVCVCIFAVKGDIAGVLLVCVCVCVFVLSWLASRREKKAAILQVCCLCSCVYVYVYELVVSEIVYIFA